MHLNTFNPPSGPFEGVTAQQAKSMWCALIEDLDTFLGAPEGYIREEWGDGPIHDALDQLTAQIMAYAPATADEAKAIIAIINHDEGAFELSDDQRQARCRAFALLDIMASENRGN